MPLTSPVALSDLEWWKKVSRGREAPTPDDPKLKDMVEAGAAQAGLPPDALGLRRMFTRKVPREDKMKDVQQRIFSLQRSELPPRIFRVFSEVHLLSPALLRPQPLADVHSLPWVLVDICSQELRDSWQAISGAPENDTRQALLELVQCLRQHLTYADEEVGALVDAGSAQHIQGIVYELCAELRAAAPDVFPEDLELLTPKALSERLLADGVVKWESAAIIRKGAEAAESAVVRAWKDEAIARYLRGDRGAAKQIASLCRLSLFASGAIARAEAKRDELRAALPGELADLWATLDAQCPGLMPSPHAVEDPSHLPWVLIQVYSADLIRASQTIAAHQEGRNPAMKGGMPAELAVAAQSAMAELAHAGWVFVLYARAQVQELVDEANVDEVLRVVGELLAALVAGVPDVLPAGIDEMAVADVIATMLSAGHQPWAAEDSIDSQGAATDCINIHNWKLGTMEPTIIAQWKEVLVARFLAGDVSAAAQISQLCWVSLYISAYPYAEESRKELRRKMRAFKKRGGKQGH